MFDIAQVRWLGWAHAAQLKANRGLLVQWLVIALLALLVFWIPARAILRIDVGVPGDGYMLRGMFTSERDADGSTFRWSGPDALFALDPLLGQLAVATLRLHRDGAEPLDAHNTIHMLRADRPIGAFELRPGWRMYTMLLPASTQNLLMHPHEWLMLRSSVVVHDGRTVGVPVDWAKLSAIGSGPTLPVLAGRTAWLLWIFVLIACSAAHLLSAWPSLRRAAGLLVLLLAGLLAFRTARDPFLLLSLPAIDLPVLGMFTLALFLPSILQRFAHGHLLAIWCSPWCRSGWVLGAVVLGAAHAVVLLPLEPMLRGIGAWVILLCPGALLGHLLLGRDCDRLTQAWVMLSGGLILLIPLLGVLALIGGLSPLVILLVCDGLSAVLASMLVRVPAADSSPVAMTHPYPALGIVIALAAALRVANLGLAEMHVDESRVLLVATAVVAGQPAALLARDKGPAEVLLAAGPLALTGQLSEGTARFPFALAGIAVVVGAYLLVRLMLPRTQASTATATGLVAAAVLAVDGLLIGFARTIQYQSLVMLLMIAALWCAMRFAQALRHAWVFLAAAILIAALGALAHYDMVYVAPALAYQLISSARRRGWGWQQFVAAATPWILIGLGLLASFFVPFVQDERFARQTLGYLSSRVGDNVALYNNLGLYEPLLTFYTPAPLVYTITVLLIIGGVLGSVRYCGRWFGGLLAVLLCVGSLLQASAPKLLTIGGLNWAALSFMLPLVGIVCAPATPAPLRMLLAWFGASFGAHAFLIAVPNTHFYSAHIPAILLACRVLFALVERVRSAWLGRWSVAPIALGLALLLASAAYAAGVFVRPAPEFLRTFPASRMQWYPASSAEQLPRDQGYYGFQRQDGWKVIGELYRQQVLAGSYASNQKSDVTGWYTQGALRCSRNPDYFIVAYRESYLMPEGYHLWGRVLTDHEPTMAIFSRRPMSEQPQVFESAQFIASFDAAQLRSIPILQTLREPLPQVQLNQSYGPVQVVGYDLDRQLLKPGQRAVVSVYTRGLTSAVRLALRDSIGTLHWLDAACPGQSPYQWQATDLQSISSSIVADSTLAAGDYTIIAQLAADHEIALTTLHIDP